ncbi:max dimerization protein 1 isoform X1 [Penaeus vannamei]|uniref:max dimerization protein 1 isoform X1 n=1 Tax=Penaeus vannamei TaxID=6689 RepID=UPI00387F9E1D
MSLAVLLQAAEYIERRERGKETGFEMEHGYASTLPIPDHYSYSKSSKRSRSKSKLQSNRTTHNELEKNRRAHLRTCLEKLKEMVPLGPDGSRHTTLGLLTRAKHFIKNLEDKDRKQTAHKNHLAREQRFLRRRLESLGTHLTPAGLDMAEVMGKRRSVSESSSLSSASTSSSSSGSSTSETGELLQDLSSVLGAPSSHNAETDEVDILGYGSNQSDTDDHSSIQSSASDGGVTISTRRLTITEPPSHAL